MKKAFALIVSLLLLFSTLLTGCSMGGSEFMSALSEGISSIEASVSESDAQFATTTESESTTEDKNTPVISEDGNYSTKDEVALYIHTYGKLPSNYITKKDAEALGWDASKGNLWKVTDHMSIGGDRFGNYEKKLPTKKDRQYYECDIDYSGGSRNAKRIVYSNDGLIYYTEDHYESFELLYGEV